MKNFLRFFFGLAIVVAAIVLIALVLESYITTEEFTIKILKTEKYETADGEKYYLVYTENEVFENRDRKFQRKENTIELAKLLRKNYEYKVRVVGFNFGVKLPFFSKYRNIVAVIDGPEIIKGKIK